MEVKHVLCDVACQSLGTLWFKGIDVAAMLQHFIND